MKIPHVLHYCWFSGDEVPESVLDNVRSWSRYLPQFTIKKWTAKEFDMNITRFSKAAGEQRNWAFVADVFRLWVLREYGGLYTDSDVELRATLEPFEQDSFFIAFEDAAYLGPHCWGSVASHPIIERLFAEYTLLEFDNSRLPALTMPKIITGVMQREFGLEANGKCQNIKQQGKIYSANFLSIDAHDGRSVAVHHTVGSWLNIKSEVPYKHILAKNYFRRLLLEDDKHLARMEQYGDVLKFRVFQVLLAGQMMVFRVLVKVAYWMRHQVRGLSGRFRKMGKGKR